MTGRHMRLRCPYSIPLAVLLAVTRTVAEDYSINWHGVDGGGGWSTGSVYTITGTIGQPDASRILTNASSQFSVVGGFWSWLRAVQLRDGPRLEIALTATNTAVIWWPASATNLVLRQSSTLPAAQWGAVAEPVYDDGVTRYIIVHPPTGNRFYQLGKP